MAGSWIDDRIWSAVVMLEFNDDSAIYKYWRELRNAGIYLGAPITAEIDTPVGRQQQFASGAVINWTPEDGASLANE